MLINRLEIKNFKGIKNCKIDFLHNLNVLIGVGNSTKSTILEAIHLLFNCSNYYNLNPQCFYNNDYNENIEITCIFSEFPNNFLSEELYGFFVLDEYQESPHLMAQFKCNSDFEYDWYIIKNDCQKLFNLTQRKKCNVFLIDDYIDNNFNYGKNSLINKYINENDVLKKEIKKSLYGNEFDIKIEELKSVHDIIFNLAKEYSVKFDNEISSILDISNLSTSTNIVGLAEKGIMISNRGKSDKRLLSIAMSIGLIENFGITLIDEPENNLEPYKIRFIARKINDLCSLHKNLQFIVTTHSPYFVYQSEIEYINIVKNVDGIVLIQKIPPYLKRLVYQNAAEAFFAKKIICCEGKTELGFLNAINEFRRKEHKEFELYGVCIINLEGDRVVQSAIDLYNLGYDIALIMDSDVNAQNLIKEEFKGLLIDCTPSKDFEYDFFKSLTNPQLIEFLNNLFSENDKAQFIGEINSAFKQINKPIEQLIDDPNFIDTLCTAKNLKNKFKNYAVGKKFGEYFCNNKKEINIESQLNKKYIKICSWVENNG